MTNDSPILYESCDQPLTTQTPDDVVAGCEKFCRLIKRVEERPERGSAIYQLDKCREIDAGGILMLVHAGMQLGKMGWSAKVSGEGEAMDLVVKHLEHFLRDSSDFDSGNKDGDYLLRTIESRSEMVAQISAWAETVRQSTEASARDVALWEFQISEVATNSFQHGAAGNNSHKVLVAGKASSDTKRVQLAAMDYGPSIPGTIEQLPITAKMEHDGQMIKIATHKGVTS